MFSPTSATPASKNISAASDAAKFSGEETLSRPHSPLLEALAGRRQPHPPVWFMRQAGRSLPEYRHIRSGIDMLDACLNPALTCEITLQPVHRYGVDAAILFSDIVVPLRLAGVPVNIVSGRGPVVSPAIDNPGQLRQLLALEPDPEARPVAAAAQLVVAELNRIFPGTPLIGFAGAPFTVASYLVEGGPSKQQLKTRALMLAEPEQWHQLMTWTARACGLFLAAQVRAGASAVQLFDSWAGTLSAADYRTRVAPYSQLTLDICDAAVAGLPLPAAPLPRPKAPECPVFQPAGRSVPVIHFGGGTGELLPDMYQIGVDALGVDYRLPLNLVAARFQQLSGGLPVLQGNLDPARLFGERQQLVDHVADVIYRGRTAPAHILNLGHGVPPDADPEQLRRVVELARSL